MLPGLPDGASANRQIVQCAGLPRIASPDDGNGQWFPRKLGKALGGALRRPLQSQQQSGASNGLRRRRRLRQFLRGLRQFLHGLRLGFAPHDASPPVKFTDKGPRKSA